MEIFSERTGIPVSTLKKYEAGRSTPGGEAIQALASAGINVHWLVTWEGDMSRADHQQPDSGSTDMVREKSGEYALVPLYDVRAAAGYGAELAGACSPSPRPVCRDLDASRNQIYFNLPGE